MVHVPENEVATAGPISQSPKIPTRERANVQQKLAMKIIFKYLMRNFFSAFVVIVNNSERIEFCLLRTFLVN